MRIPAMNSPFRPCTKGAVLSFEVVTGRAVETPACPGFVAQMRLLLLQVCAVCALARPAGQPSELGRQDLRQAQGELAELLEEVLVPSAPRRRLNETDEPSCPQSWLCEPP